MQHDFQLRSSDKKIAIRRNWNWRLGRYLRRFPIFFQKRNMQFFRFPKPTDDEVGRLPPEPLDDSVEARLFALKNVKWLLFPDLCFF